MFDNMLSPNLEVWSKGSDNMSACLLVFKQSALKNEVQEKTGFAKLKADIANLFTF
jgi:hypothetical protein